MKIELTEPQVKSILDDFRKSGEADKRFDVNLAEGKMSENRFASSLNAVEVKSDFKCAKTGNVAIEYASRGKPSGISTTEALWWAIELMEWDGVSRVMILIETERLKELCRRYIGTSRDVSGGDDNTSQIILLPLTDVTQSCLKTQEKKDE